jgi:ubiquinone/menaquinone biosynthesis C-methylase UbiE
MRMDRAPAAYDDVADAYLAAFDPDGSPLQDPVFEELLGEVAGERVLALACGQGRDARLLADLGANVAAIDVSAEMLRHARAFEEATPRGIRFEQADAQTLAGYASASFDGVACNMALMDIPDLSSAIGSVARVLRPGGWFVFSIVHPCYRGHVDNVSDYLVDSRYEKNAPIAPLPVHAYHRPVGMVVNTLAEAGLGISEMREVHHDEPKDRGDVPGLLYARCVRR